MDIFPHQIYSSRILQSPIDRVYRSFSDPEILKLWWGPEGFTNTFHEFDLRPEGRWTLTMHGPEKGNYENSSVFKTVIPQQKVAWTRVSKPLFDMEVGFEHLSSKSTRIYFLMSFPSGEECEKMRPFVEPKNEENFDRLKRLLGL